MEQRKKAMEKEKQQKKAMEKATKGGVSKGAATRGKKKRLRPIYAKGPTRVEFVDLMGHISSESESLAAELLCARPDHPLLVLGEEWSYDNPSIHDADLSSLGITELNRYPLPPQSGDMHKVIEHVHAILCGAMSAWVARNPKVTKAADLRAKMRELFFEVINPTSVSADVASLPKLWRWIKDNGGKYSPNRLGLK